MEIHAYAGKIVIRQDGGVVAERVRSFGRGETIYDTWHYVPVLARKPGALRNGAPLLETEHRGGKQGRIVDYLTRSTSSCSMNSAISRSRKPAGNCSST